MPHKKGHTKKHSRRHKKVKKGGFYGASGAIAPGAMEWKAGSEMGGFSVSSRGGNTQYGASRHKGSKKGKKTRKMRGGGKFGGVSASFTGSGERGMANYVGVNTRGGTGSPAGGMFNYHGALPGSGGDSFVRI